MKKVCILQNGLARGGTDTFVRNLAKGLDKEEYDVTIVNTSSVPECTIGEKELEQCGIKLFHTTPPTGLFNIVKHLLQLYKFLKKEKFDIFQTNIDLFNGPNLFVAFFAGVPVRECHSHNALQQRELSKGLALSTRFYQRLMRWMCWNFSNRRCGCSRMANEFLFKGKDWGNGDYPHIINNGIDLDRFKINVNKDNKLKELKLPDKKFILTVGHLIPQKNPLFIAELFSDFCEENDEYDLIWVGNGILKDEVIKIIEKRGVRSRVHFFDNRDDINEIMNCADVFILPSNFEGLGIVAIEAQACQLPVLLSNKIPNEADCGLAEYLPIDQGTRIWIRRILEILRGESLLKLDKNKLSRFSTQYMVEQMMEVFEL